MVHQLCTKVNRIFKKAKQMSICLLVVEEYLTENPGLTRLQEVYKLWIPLDWGNLVMPPVQDRVILHFIQ